MAQFHLTNITWVWTEGQVGIERRGYLEDADGLVNLDQFDEVKVRVAEKPTSVRLLDAAVDPDADQSTSVLDDDGQPVSGKGWFTYTTDAEAAAIPADDAMYKMQFVGIIDDVEYPFPQRATGERNFALLKVNAVLGTVPTP